jgi:Hemerythrin HHE cation binding domain
MNRLDVYTAVHKMQRSRLFELTIAAGRADPIDTVTSTRLAGAVTALSDELTRHAEHEDLFIHPLLRIKVPELAKALDAAHVELDGRLAELKRTARTQSAGSEDPSALYRTLASFTASYLEHLALEEGEALPALWRHCSDGELLGIMTSFKASRSPLENLASLVAQLPSANPTEVARLVSVGIDPTELSSLAQLLATTLDPDQLGALQGSLFV